MLRDLWALGKPRVTLMNVLMAAGGMALAGSSIPLLTAIALLLGTALAVSSANALNMAIEHNSDGLMARTRTRPLPAGRLSLKIATLYGVCIGVLGVLLLSLAGPIPALLGLGALLVYVLVYTPMKQRSAWALIVGAVPGALPPLMGWSAATGAIEAPGLTLFALLFLWQLPHFLAISLFRSTDYAQAGIHTVPAAMGARAARIQALACCTFLVPLSLMLLPLGVAGPLFAIVATVMGVYFWLWSARGLVQQPAPDWARRFFISSVIYLPVTTIALAFDALIF